LNEKIANLEKDLKLSEGNSKILKDVEAENLALKQSIAALTEQIASQKDKLEKEI